jgi:putative ABC transport system permease protein
MNKSDRMPRASLKFLLRFMDFEERENFAEVIEAVYCDLHNSKGRRAARFWFWGQFLRSSPKLLLHSIQGDAMMFKNYLKTALRAMRKHKAPSLINIAGLTIGITCAVLIALFIRNELSYDRFHEKLDSLYCPLTRIHEPDGSVKFQSTIVHLPHGPALKEYFPGVRRSVRVFPRRFVVKIGDLVEYQEIALVDRDFFEMFSFPLKQGHPAKVLSDLSSIVISESYAKKYFKKEDPAGKRLTLISGNRRNDFLVTGVAKDAPANSTITFNFAANIESLRLFGQAEDLANWQTLWGRCRTYIELQDRGVAETIERQYSEFAKTYYTHYFERERSDRFKNAAGNIAPLSFGLQRMADVHLDPRATGSKKLAPVYILGGIAFIILFIAGINFITLSIGNASSRIIEVGVRKVIGADRRHLIWQYWVESLILSGIALVFGVGLACLSLPTFNRLTQQSMTLSALLSPVIMGVLVFLSLLLGVAVGSYPALVLSRLHPVDIFKGRSQLGGRNFFSRLLVTLQFALSIFLVVSTFVLGRQVRFMTDQNLGFAKDQRLIINNIGGSTVYDRLKNRFSSTPGIIGISGTVTTPAGVTNYSPITYNGKAYDFTCINYIDENYFKDLDIEVLRGRNFAPEIATDRQAVLVNEALVKKLNMANPIGETIEFQKTLYPIIGVAKDYIIEDKRNEIPPAVHFFDPTHDFSHMIIHFSTSELSRVLANARSAWKEFQPDRPFSYSFLDEDVEARYVQEKRWDRIVGYSSAMALIIAGLGVFGLASATVSRRVKEIGIRKVCGASISGIVVLLSRDLARCVILANLVAWPISFFAMSKWLQNYAYRAGWSLWIFILSGLAALAMALLTMSFQTIKAATANPVDSLRYE